MHPSPNTFPIVCYVCEKLIDNPEDRIIFTTSEGSFIVCNYCNLEQAITAEEDEQAQEEGLMWAQRVIASIQ
jgi:hypothetical protein